MVEAISSELTRLDKFWSEQKAFKL
jgi:hypothetical protein